MSYFRSLLPPYYKYAVFIFVGWVFVYCAFVLAVSEAYYKSAALLLPIAYKIFDDTVEKGAPDFDWTIDERQQLEMYKTKMMFCWIISTIGVILAMLIIIPQFFDFNDRRGNPSHLCLVQRKLAWVLSFMIALLVLAMGIAVFAVWYDGSAAVRSFHEHFHKSEKEEVFLTELEEKLECTTDDDKEVPVEHLCQQNVRMSFITDLWLDIMMYSYVAGFTIAFLAIPLFNKQLIKPDDDDVYEDDKKLLEKA